MRYAIAIALMLMVPALAQQPAPQADPAFMQKALTALQAQRNAALDGQAAAQAQAAMLTEEVATLKKQIEDLKPKSDKPADAK